MVLGLVCRPVSVTLTSRFCPLAAHCIGKPGSYGLWVPVRNMKALTPS